MKSAPKESSPARAMIRRLLHRSSILCLLVFLLLALFGPLLAPYGPDALDLRHQFEAPSQAHWLGTGDNGVDLLSACLHGARLAGVVAFSVVFITSLVGMILGTLSAYVGGAVDYWLGALMDLLQAFPSILLHIAILALVADPELIHLVVALSISGWVLYARLARSQALSLRRAEFVEAAVVLGIPPWRVLFRHVLPNLVGPIVVQATTAAGGVILAEATLSFLGLGPATNVSWGALLDQGSGVLLSHPHVALLSGTVIAAAVLTLNLAGDAMQDEL